MQKQKNVFIQTFGCQMNKLDSELSLGLVRETGYGIATEIGDADIILYNTCSVRAHAEEKVYSHIGALKARKLREPGLIIGVLGCMAQKDGKQVFKRSPHVNLVIGTRMLHKLPDILRSAEECEEHILAVDKDQFFSIPRFVNGHDNGFQNYVSIMRGCDNYCTYCIVPYVRGSEVSRKIDDIYSEVYQLADHGCREVTLLGQNVNSYGKGLDDGSNLARLLQKIGKIDKLERIRFVTSHPKDVTKELLEEMKNNPKICRYLHLPAQSGSDKILQKMNRKYTSKHYKDLVANARKIMPGISISSDFIVGFPGENDADFNETVELLNDVRFFNCFVFKYSPRKGTVASRLKDDIEEKIKKDRNQILLNLQKKISLEENTKLIGSNFDVLVERLNTKTFAPKSTDKPEESFQGNFMGRTKYNHIVIFSGEDSIIGKTVSVKIDNATEFTLYGKQLN